MRNRRALAAIGACALAVALGACSSGGGGGGGGTSGGATGSSGGSATGSGNGSLTTLDIGEVPFYADMALALGEKVGIFAHYGLNVVLQPSSNVNVTIANLHSGHQQLGFVTTPLLLKADQAGQDSKCVAPLGIANNVDPSYPQNAVMVAKNSNITSLSQLAGKSVGLNQLAGSNELYLQAGIQQAGGDFSSVHLATVPFADMPAALKSGTIQAAFEVQPFITSGEQAGDQKLLAGLDSLTSPWTTDCYAATSSYLSANTALMTRFAHAQSQAILYAQAHPADALDQIASVSGLSEAAAKASVPPKIQYTNDLQPASIIKYADFMTKYKALNGSAVTQDQVAWVAPGEPATKLLFGAGGKYTG
jgi:NitT/TauT family transport system substrate-binding protein